MPWLSVEAFAALPGQYQPPTSGGFGGDGYHHFTPGKNQRTGEFVNRGLISVVIVLEGSQVPDDRIGRLGEAAGPIRNRACLSPRLPVLTVQVAVDSEGLISRARHQDGSQDGS